MVFDCKKESYISWVNPEIHQKVHLQCRKQPIHAQGGVRRLLTSWFMIAKGLSVLLLPIIITVCLHLKKADYIDSIMLYYIQIILMKTNRLRDIFYMIVTSEDQC